MRLNLACLGARTSFCTRGLLLPEGVAKEITGNGLQEQPIVDVDQMETRVLDDVYLPSLANVVIGR